MWRQVAVTHQNKTKRTNSVSVLANTKLVRRVGAGSDLEERIRSFPAHLPTFPLMKAMRDIFGISQGLAIGICRAVINACARNRGIARETIVRSVLKNRTLARSQEVHLSPNKTYVIYLSAATIKQINKVYGQSQEPPTLDQIMEIAETCGYDRILHSMI